MHDLLTGIGFKTKAAVAALVAALTLSCDQRVEVRTWELQELSESEAISLVSPYVFEGREGTPGTMTVAGDVLTVREMPENLDRIAEALERYDRAPTDVRLTFQVIEADGFTGGDEAIAEVEAELRQLLRYRGYRLVGESVMQLREGGAGGQQSVAPSYSADQAGPPPPLTVMANIDRVTRSGDAAEVVLEVVLEDPWDQLLSTVVTVRDGQSLVLGTTTARTAPDGGRAALILVVKPEIR